jgi:hypothetical protein
MKKLAIIGVLLAASIGAQAQTTCFGSGAFQTCSDLSTGNTYNVQRFGNTTMMQGSNSNTGTNWDQTSHTFGNTTQHYGTAGNGNTWSGTTISTPSMQQHFGTDSSGQSYNKICTALGCF